MANIQLNPISTYILEVLYYQYGGRTHNIYSVSSKILSQYTLAECSEQDIETNIKELLKWKLIEVETTLEDNTEGTHYLITDLGIEHIEVTEDVEE